MKPEDLFGLGVMLVTMLLVLGSMVRTSRRLSRARPELTGPPAPPRRIVHPPPPPARVPAPAVAPPKRTATPTRRPASPSLEARVLGNRRLSTGARLVVASEILSRPKALRPRRPL